MTYPEQELEEISKSLKLTLSAHSNSKEEYTGDCERCLCNSCTNIETCKAKEDEILTEFRVAPCNGCLPGQRFMPKESACCPKYGNRN